MSEDINKINDNEEAAGVPSAEEPVNAAAPEEPAVSPVTEEMTENSAPAEPAGLPTPEEEAAKAIEEAKQTEAERLEAERRRQEAEWEANFRRAEEERRREQEEKAEAIRRENEARREAEEAAKAERKARKKKGLRLTAAVLAVALLVGAAGYAAGGIAKTINSLKDQVSSLEEAQTGDRAAQNTQPESLPASTDPSRPSGSFGPGSRPGRESTEAQESRTAAETESREQTDTAREGEAVVATAAISGNNASSSLTDVSDIVENTLPSVVSIVVTVVTKVDSYWGGTREYEQTGAGSGIIIGDDGSELWIVTNYHVIEDATDIEITFCDEETVKAYIKGSDKDNDLAVLGVKMQDMKKSTLGSIKVITIGESDSLKLGQGVIAIGNALGWGQSVTTGVVSAMDREVEFEDGTKMYLLQTSAAINPGNSGGALLNSKGELIGINNAKYSDTDVEGIGFAIPISSVKEIMNKLSLMQPRVAVSDSEYPYLGVTFKNLSSGYMEAYGIPKGAYIYEVGKDTPAEKAGLLAYDIITGFGDAKISSYDDLVNELQYYKGGSEVELTVMRLNRGEYSEVKVTVTLGLRSDYQN